MDHINIDQEGRVAVCDLERALKLIKHAPEDDVVSGIVKKLDVDSDGFVPFADVLSLVNEEGLGTILFPSDHHK